MSAAKPKFVSIRLYLIIVNLFLICLLFPTLSVLFWQKTSQLQEDDLAERIKIVTASLEVRGISLMNSMTLSANQAIASFDFSFINQLTQQVANSDSELQYCMLTNLNTVVVAHSNPSLVGSKALRNDFDIQAKALLEGGFNKTLLEDSKANSVVKILRLDVNAKKAPGVASSYEVMSPVYNGSQLWGGLRCGYQLNVLEDLIKTTEQKWQKERDQFTWFIIGFGVLFFLLALLVTIIFSHRFIRAIEKLNFGVKAVTDGDLDFRIKSKGLLCSEFSNLSMMINNMTDNLQLSRNELSQYSESLEGLVAERTSELEAVNKELETFSYSVSHDLRAPLRRIDGFSEVVIEDYGDSLNEQGVEYLKRIRAATDSMGSLIDSLLKFSRINREPLNKEKVNITDLANQIIDELVSAEPDRDVSVVVASELEITADKNLIKILLTNLLSNAWKYSSKQASAIIEVGMQEQEGKAVYFVKDNGAGFDMKYSDKLFSAFQRLHKEGDYEGTGIGLATVNRIIIRHAGRIWAEAEEGGGATFYFVL